VQLAFSFAGDDPRDVDSGLADMRLRLGDMERGLADVEL